MIGRTMVQTRHRIILARLVLKIDMDTPFVKSQKKGLVKSLMMKMINQQRKILTRAQLDIQRVQEQVMWKVEVMKITGVMPRMKKMTKFLCGSKITKTYDD